MYEEVCLVCGKHLLDDGRAYCSDDCQNSDLTSPSISSSSSALSSPHLGYANGVEVPALMPSALGTALRKYQGRDPYCVNASASSSSPWSLTEDDDDDVAFGRGIYRDNSESVYDGSSKSANFVYSMGSALTYARRPSGTNNHSIVPRVHRSSPGSSPAPGRRHAQGVPRSAPNRSRSSTDEEEEFSDHSFSSRGPFAAEDNDSERSKPLTSKAAKARNRSSLPAYFSLLQINPLARDGKIMSPAPSSANTVARPSPPTPKHTLPSIFPKTFVPPVTSAAIVQDPPRGRRRYTSVSKCSRRSERSSPSRSRSRQIRGDSPRHTRGRIESEEIDWPTAEIPRGRTSNRRNSSPPPRMLIAQEPARVVVGPKAGTRGRVPVKELDGIGTMAMAPGYGNGRSGLVDRERMADVKRVLPL